MNYNKNPILMTEGKAFIDGVEVLDCVKLEIKVTPDVWTGKQLGERTPSSRWKGITITGTMTERRSTNWLEVKIKEYLSTGVTPEFTIQGIMNDENSDYYQDIGNLTVTVVGGVMTGDLNLMALDTNGDVVEDSISFNFKDIV